MSGQRSLRSGPVPEPSVIESPKVTMAALFGVAGSRQRARDCADRGHAALAAAGLSGYLPAILDWTLTRSR